MLHEFSGIRQTAKGYRKLFSDNELQLYVWYEAVDSKPIGFQLVYEEAGVPKAFSWTRKRDTSTAGLMMETTTTITRRQY
jgi:hypothetical protein